jgi:hypothetical protein
VKISYFIFCIIFGIGAVFFYTQALTGLNNVDERVHMEVRVYTATPTPTPNPTVNPTPTSTSSGGGGGGGGGGGETSLTPIPAVIELKGYAYPNATVNILKDGAGVGSVSADSEGNFSFLLSGLSGGSYNFGFWAQDKSGKRSVTFTFQITLNGGSTTKVSGIVLPPTIGLNKTSVSRGEAIVVSGASVPSAQIRIQIAPRQKEYLTKASLSGDYSQTISINGLEKGLYTAKSRTEITSATNESVFSQLVSFGVDTSVPKATCSGGADINKDGKVNLVDFSIMAFWWNKKISQGSLVDLNCDGILNLADFSILAFGWTG